jgi:hypothetical protein
MRHQIIRVWPTARVLCVLASLAGACEKPGAPASERSSAQRTAAPISAKDTLLALLQRDATPVLGRPTDSTVTFTVDTSRAVPGLVYYWAVHRPPRSMHARQFLVAAYRDSLFRIIQGPADWAAAAHGWTAATSADALVACGELLRTASSNRNPFIAPHVVEIVDSVRRLPIPDPLGTAKLVSPARVDSSSTGWAATFWAVEARDVNRYRCTLSNAVVSLSKIDSIPGQGFLPD